MYVDIKYINLISPTLDNFKIVKPNVLYNFRCPFCGDSAVSQTKARGYIYCKNNAYKFHCHNCGWHISFAQFLKNVNKDLFYQYKLETIKDNEFDNDPVLNIKKSKVISASLKSLEKVSSLPIFHPCKQYIQKRKIPSNKHYNLFWCNKFNQWVNSIIKDKIPSEVKEHGRLIIPFLTKSNELHGFQGRLIKDNTSGLRYVTINLNDSIPCIYGMHSVNFNELVLVVEGPIDSLFLPNAIAMARADFGALESFLDKEKTIIIFDNEPRSETIKKKMIQAVELGYKICVWPMSIDKKDINDMILSGLTTDDIYDMIIQNAYSGTMARIRISSWSKI